MTAVITLDPPTRVEFDPNVLGRRRRPFAEPAQRTFSPEADAARRAQTGHQGMNRKNFS